MGRDEVYVLDGGLAAWSDAGGAVEAGATKAEPQPFQEVPAQWADAEEQRLNYTTPDGWHTHLAGSMDLAAMDRIDDAWRAAVKEDQPLQKAS